MSDPAPSTSPTRAPRSLRVRLLWGTVVGVAVALVLTGAALTALFRDHVVSQFQAALSRQLDQLIVELEFDSSGEPTVDPAPMLDPRLQKPYSGLYWQIDELRPGQPARIGVLRSRSLWDANLALPPGDDGNAASVTVVEGQGPAHESLLILHRVVTSDESPGRRFRLIVAGDLRFNLEATQRFGQALAIALALLLGVLVLTAWAQVSIGLRPLRDLQAGLKSVRDGKRQRLAGSFPQEIQPLVDDFNHVLTTNAEIVDRARTQAGNLAHALKTPLAVLENEAALARDGTVPVALLREQLAQVRRHVDWHLKRARVAAARGLPGLQTDVTETLGGLLRVLQRVFADKTLQVDLQGDTHAAFAGEAEDLQEMLGNLLENAFKWARTRVAIDVRAEGAMLTVRIEDDGPGIDASQRQAVTHRGVRLDESTPGSGLGLAIVQDLVQHYGGALTLDDASTGSGLCVTLSLPRAATS
ncbi:MAG: HAMP domain-containing sensor histidine kinase [Rhodocyclaceae bacterium]